MQGKSENRSLRNTWRLLHVGLQLIWRADRRLLITLGGLQAAVGLGFAVQLLMGRKLVGLLGAGISDANPRQQLPALVWTTVVIVVATLVVGFATSAQPAVARLLGEIAVLVAFERIFAASYAAELKDFDDPKFYDRLQRARVHSLAPMEMCTHLAAIGGALFAAVGIGTALAFVAPLVVPIVILGLVPLLLATTRSSRELYDFSFGFAPHDRKMMYVDGLFTDQQSAAEVRSFALYDFLLKRYKVGSDERIRNVRRLARAELRRSGVASTASAVLRTGAVAAVVALWLSGSLSLASAAVAVVAVQQLSGRFDGLSAPISAFYRNVLYIEDLVVFFRMSQVAQTSARPAIEPASNGGARLDDLRTLRADDVWFSYPSDGGDDRRAEALQGVSIKLARGEVVALVGRNGSGKTTLAKILCGLYRPSTGRLAWNGVDLSSTSMERLRDRVGIIFQDFQKYQFSARDNIVAGRPERVAATDDIARAARLARAADIIEELPDGYDTILSKRWTGGTDLSIGQWQRVAVARAVYRDADLLVLDEPTSALDPRGEKEMFDSIRELCKSKAVLFISHRFSTVKLADRIVVLEEGKVVEEGTHAELMARQGLYHELYSIQAAAYTDAAPATSVS